MSKLIIFFQFYISPQVDLDDMLEMLSKIFSVDLFSTKCVIALFVLLMAIK